MEDRGSQLLPYIVTSKLVVPNKKSISFPSQVQIVSRCSNAANQALAYIAAISTLIMPQRSPPNGKHWGPCWYSSKAMTSLVHLNRVIPIDTCCCCHHHSRVS